MTLARLILAGGVVGTVLAYLWQARRHLQPYQSKLRWVPALVVGRRLRVLAELVAVMAVGAAFGALAGATAHATLDAIAR